MKHWAAELIGKPWSPDGVGPKSFSCWGLVRYAVRCVNGIDLPPVPIDAAISAGWKPTQESVQENDVVVMSNVFGHRHIGLMTKANGKLGLLHSSETAGCVVFQSLQEATSAGFHNFELWRRQ